VARLFFCLLKPDFTVHPRLFAFIRGRLFFPRSSQPPIPYPLLRRHLWLEHALDIDDYRRRVLLAEPGKLVEGLAALMASAVRAAYAAGLPGAKRPGDRSRGDGK